ncbi:MAG: hypothetical protein CMM48_16300 [Rhodospirillaceae bacterium]|nr:hypothetical protein [Rhodospirillaceae bacterium]
MLPRKFVSVAVVCTALGLVACEQAAKIGGDPFITKTPQNLPRADRQDYVSVCYNADTTTREAVMALARQECKQGGSQVRIFSHDMIFNDCPVVTKARATFLCIPPKP